MKTENKTEKMSYSFTFPLIQLVSGSQEMAKFSTWLTWQHLFINCFLVDLKKTTQNHN